MTNWDNESITRLNYSLINLNNRLVEIRDILEEKNEHQKYIAGSLQGILEVMIEQDIVSQEREKKESMN